MIYQKQNSLNLVLNYILICITGTPLLCAFGLNTIAEELVWESTNFEKVDFYPKEVHSLLVTPNDILYAGTSAGVYRLESGGNSWMELDIPGDLLTIFDSTIYVVRGKGVYKLEPKKDSWTRCGTELTDVREVAVTETAIYAGRYSFGLYRLKKENNSWESLGFEARTPISLLVAGLRLFMGTDSQIGVGDGLFYSDDGGDSWTRTGLSGWRVESICLSEQERRIYIGTRYSGSIFYSDDNGHSWTDITGNLPNEAKTVSSLVTVDSTLYAAIRDKGVFRDRKSVV